jgi:polyphosphate glucokinase
MTATPLAREQLLASPDSRILAIDIGGSGLKAAILSYEGDMMTERHRIKTPHPLTTDLLVEKLVELVQPLSDYHFVSVGFPGVVRNGKIITAPNLGTEQLRGFNLEAALAEKLGKPVRVVNDADMQGLGAIEGRGIEMVITLGTGFGSALFMDGDIAPHLEIAHMPFRKGETFDLQVGDKARKRIGKRAWNRRVKRAIELMRTLTNFDRLYVGGGNAQAINFDLPSDVTTVSNEFGVRGGAWLWRKRE